MMTEFKIVLLTGATGFLGFRTLEILVKTESIKHIIATGRTLKEGMKLDSSKVDYQLGDLSEGEFVNNLVKGVDAIVHCAALSSPWGKVDDFEKANVISQQNLIKAANTEGIKRFIFVSTPALYFDFNDRFNIKESDSLPSKFVNDYALTKRHAEKLLEESNLEYVILRPRALCGRGDTVIMPRMIRAHVEGKLKIIGNGNNLVDVVSVSNVVDAILLSLYAKDEALRNIYNITNGKPIKLWEMISLVLSKIGKELSSKKMPFKIAYYYAGFLEFKARLGGMRKEPIYTRYSISTLAKSFTMDISKANSLLNYHPKVSTEEALEEFVNWYLENEKS